MVFRARLLAVLVFSFPFAVTSQTVSGRVFNKTLARPLAGALVQIQDSLGRVVASGTSNARGNFLLRLSKPGSFRWRVAAIGFTPQPLQRFVVTELGVVLPDAVLIERATQLGEILARGEKTCGLQPGDASVFNGVLDAAQTALEVMELTVSSGAYEFEVMDTYVVTGRAVPPAKIQTRPPLLSWPVRALEPEKLEKDGFSTVDSLGPVVRHYYGPDPRVLFSTWFLAGHCYSFDRGKDTDPTVTLRFEPIARTKSSNPADSARVDIAGSMVFDRTTLSLQKISWEHRNLPRWIKPNDTGGYLEFQLHGGEIWYPFKWVQRAPSETLRISGALDPRGASRRLMGPVVGVMEVVSQVIKVVKNHELMVLQSGTP